MFSNLAVKPIQHRSESNEAEERLGELLVAGADASQAFDACKEILDDVTVRIEQLGIVILDFIGDARRNARLGVGRDQFLAKRASVKTAVADNPAVGELIDQHRDGSQIIPISGHHMESRGASQSIDNNCDLGVGSAPGLADGLSSSPAGCVGCILVRFDVRAVDGANLAASIPIEDREHLRPKAAATPTAEARVDGTPRPKLSRKIAPRQTGSQNEVNATHHKPIVLWRSAATLLGHTSSAGLIRSIFLADPRADPALLADLMYS